MRLVRVLAVDFGEKRIGLAVSDEAGRVVVPVGALERESDEKAAAAVAQAARERNVARLVVGLPRSSGGTEGLFARRARNFARRLSDASGLPVDLHDETLTSAAADDALDDAGVSARSRLGARGHKRARTGARDAEAAAVLLRDWLSAHGEGP